MRGIGLYVFRDVNFLLSVRLKELLVGLLHRNVRKYFLQLPRFGPVLYSVLIAVVVLKRNVGGWIIKFIINEIERGVFVIKLICYLYQVVESFEGISTTILKKRDVNISIIPYAAIKVVLSLRTVIRWFWLAQLLLLPWRPAFPAEAWMSWYRQCLPVGASCHGWEPISHSFCYWSLRVACYRHH